VAALSRKFQVHSDGTDLLGPGVVRAFFQGLAINGDGFLPLALRGMDDTVAIALRDIYFFLRREVGKTDGNYSTRRAVWYI
jgi:hypothetical protein